MDLFRIRIWDIDNADALVYDNQLGADEDADPTTAIAGGSIVIHKGKNKKTEDAELPTEFALHGNFPNRFNPSTSIRFDLPEASDVVLSVFDLLGREVARLVDGQMPQGRHEVTWRGDGVPSGVYVYRMDTEDFRETKQMVLLK